MDGETLLRFLRSYKNGEIDERQAVERLKKMPFEDMGFAKVDHHRALRSGYPEVIFCQGKTPGQVKMIAESILEKGGPGLMGSRAGREDYEAVRSIAPDAVYHEMARMITVERREIAPPEKRIAIVSAGTADMPVAEEAAVTAHMLGNRVRRIYDVGVAGIHRLLAQIDSIAQASVVIVVAGMEGALASVVGGLVDVPVVAVPTSVGYGASFGGIAALLAMLNSCSAGIGVVNIDNGFGAAWLASRINRRTDH